MKKLIALILIGLQVSPMSAYAYQSNELNLYASVHGSDIYGNGTKLRPYKTVEKINEKAKELIRTGTNKNINVIFREGEYTLDKTISFSYLDKGKYKGILTYKSYNGEKVIFLGADKGYNWISAGDGIYKTKVSSEVNILYENGEAAIKARFPDRGERRSDGYLAAAAGGTSTKLMFNAGDFPTVENQTDLQIYLWPGGETFVYALDNPGISVDYAANAIALKNHTANNVPASEGSRYYLQNAMEFLNEPGEMYYNSSDGYVYYIPYDVNALKDVYIPKLNTAFNISGANEITVSNVSVEGIEIKYFGTERTITSNTIDINYADNIKISNCVIDNCGGVGISTYFGDNSEFSGNRMTNLGGEGMRIRYSKSADNKGNHLIKDNYIKRIGLYDADSSGISLSTTSSNSILNNTVTDSPRAAINIGTGSCQLWNLVGKTTVIDGVTITRENAKPYLTCNDNIVRYNDLSNCMQETNDGGVIYTWGTGYDNDFSYNYIHDSITDFSFTFGGIYIDDDCSKTTVTNNFIRDIHSGDGDMQNVIIVKGQDNVVDNNFVVDCTPTNGILRVDSESGAGPVGNAVFTNNLIYNSGNVMYGFYSYSKNPSNPLNIKFKECDRNLFYSNGEDFKALVRKNGGAMITLAEQDKWLSSYGHDRNSVFEEAEFTDKYSNDYRLKSSSPAIALGISGIDISQCGVSGKYKLGSDNGLERVFIKENGISDVMVSVGESKKLEAVAKMSDTSVREDAKITFYSSDTSVLAIDGKGDFTAKSKGKATVTAVAQFGEKIVTDELYIVVK